MPDSCIILGLHNNTEYCWDPLASINPHALIVGASGAGKTQLLKSMVAGMSKHGIPIVIFDVHSEYHDVVKDHGGRVVDFYSEIRINPLDPMDKIPKAIALEIREIIASIFRSLGDVQLNLLYDLILETYKRKGIEPDTRPSRNIKPPDFDDLAEILEERYKEDPGNVAIQGLMARLKPLLDFGLFSGERGINISDLLQPTITAFDLGSLPVPSEDLRKAIVIFTIRKLWDHLYMLGPIGTPQLRLALILEEAHKYTPKIVRYSPVNYMLREGRKYGVSILMASHVLSDFSDVAITNTGLKVVLKIDNPKDKRKILEILEVKRSELPRKKLEALVYLDGQVEQIEIIPYYKYREKTRERKTLNRETQETPGSSLRPSTYIQQGKPKSGEDIIRNLIETAVKNKYVPLIDALYQWSIYPADHMKYYEINYRFISDNLKSRYGYIRTKEIIEIIKNNIKNSIKNAEEVHLRSRIKEYLKNYGGLELLKHHVINNVSKLSPTEKLALYIVTGSLTEDPSNAFDLLFEAKKILEELDIYMSVDELVALAIRVGVANRLLWISSRGNKREIIFKTVSFLDEIYEELERCNTVRDLIEEFKEAVINAVNSWNTEALRALLRLEELRTNYLLGESLNLSGPEKYVRVLARHIRWIMERRGYYLVPETLRRFLIDALNGLKAHIRKVETITGEYITEYTRSRLPYTERAPSSSMNCARINLFNNREILSFEVCIWPYLKTPTSSSHNRINVAVVAPLSICDTRVLEETKTVNIIATPKGIISCSARGVPQEILDFAGELIKRLKANIQSGHQT